MPHTASLLHVLADLSVMAGVAADKVEALALINAKLREYRGVPPPAALIEAAAERGDCPSCPWRDPARQAALDGLAGAFLQASEHFELLAEPPQAAMASEPRPD